MKTVETRWNKKDGFWSVYLGRRRLAREILVKTSAVAYGRTMARKFKAEHLVKNKDGKIAFRNSYGNDPRSSKG